MYRKVQIANQYGRILSRSLAEVPVLNAQTSNIKTRPMGV
jgi:hypothetical protein